MKKGCVALFVVLEFSLFFLLLYGRRTGGFSEIRLVSTPYGLERAGSEEMCLVSWLALRGFA